MILLIFTTSSIQKANAHVLKSDGSIGAVIHIDPDDDPVAGSISTLHFDFNDKEHKFSVDECECKLQIKSNKGEILNTNLNQSQANSASVDFTFPETGLYELIITGKSSPDAFTVFSDFKISDSIRVERTSSLPSEATKTTKVHSSGFMQVLLFELITLTYLLFCFLPEKKINT